MKVIIKSDCEDKFQNFTLKVKPSSKIINIKAQIKVLTGLWIKHQNLFYNYTKLEDNKKLIDYSIPNEATLNFRKEIDPNISQICLKPSFGKQFTIEVTQKSTFFDVKNDIYELRGIPPNQQQITNYFGVQVFSDNMTVLKEMHPNSIVYITFAMQNPKKIFVKKPKSAPIQFTVDDNTAIDDIKYEITKSDKINSVKPKYELTFLGIRLDDLNTVKDYLIPENATLHFLKYQNNGIIIFIEDGPNNFIPLEVHPNESISEIKSHINEIYGISTDQKSLLYKKKQLLDKKQLQFYRIHPYESIELKPAIKIFIKLPLYDDPFSLHVDPQIEINELKMMIEQEIGIKSSDQNLIFQCERLRDNFTIDHYSITNDSILLVSPSENNEMKIIVSVNDQLLLIIKKIPTIFVSELKSIINEKTGTPIEKQMLYNRDGKILNNDDSLLVYSNENEFNINLLTIKRGGFFIFVRLSYYKLLPIEVLLDDTCLYIKNEIQEKTGIPINEQLIHKDITKISESSISPGEILSFTRRKEGSVQIYIRLLTGNYVAHYVCLNDTVKDLKESIEMKVGYPAENQFLICNAKPLENNNTLESHNISEDSTIQVILKLRG